MVAMTSNLSETFNGLPLSELQQIPEQLREAPEQGLLGFEARTTWLGGLKSRSVIEAFEAGGQRIERRHVIDADEPVQVLGGDTAPNPQELLFSAIGSCPTAGLPVYATPPGNPSRPRAGG